MFKICSCVISDPVSVRSDFSTNIEGNPWNDRELLRSVMRGLWTVNPAWREARIEKSLDIKVNLLIFQSICLTFYLHDMCVYLRGEHVDKIFARATEKSRSGF